MGGAYKDGATSFSVGPVTYTRNADGTSTQSASVGVVSYTTTQDAGGNVTGTETSVGNDYAGASVRTGTDANGNPYVTESVHIKIPGIPGVVDGFDYNYTQTGDPRDPNYTAQSGPGRAVNGITGGLVDKIVDRNRSVQDAINDATGDIDPGVSDNVNAASKWVPRRDPLILDLNGNGLDHIGTSTTRPIYFDHQGNGVKTSSGWVLPSDGFVVMDRNGNGSIDDGTELFGDSTVSYAGGKAVDGFAALAQEDSNQDGKVNQNDANWQHLRVWQDLNQDGASQAGELSTMEQAGVAAVNVGIGGSQAALGAQVNGNFISSLGSFVKTNGTEGAIGAVGQMADVDLAQNTFYSKFTDHIPLAAGVDKLPTMVGSGRVREIREAASIDSAAGADLRAKLAAYAAAGTRESQMAMLDDLIIAWGNTSTMPTSATSLTDTVRMLANLHPEWVALEQFNGTTFVPRLTRTVDAGKIVVSHSPEQIQLLEKAWDALRASVYNELLLQTRFAPVLNDIYLHGNASGTWVETSGAIAGFEARIAQAPAGGLGDLIEFTAAAKDILQNSDGKLWKLLSVQLEAAPMTAELSAMLALHRVAATGQTGYAVTTTSVRDDIVYGGDSADSVAADKGNDLMFGRRGADNLNGGDGNDRLYGGSDNDTLRGDAGDDLLDGETGNDVLHGGAGNDKLAGDAGDDTLHGDDGADVLDGGEGSDTLHGGAGNDTLQGGAGNDTLNGGAGSDAYRFASGFGKDIIVQNDGVAARQDVVSFSDLKSTDLVSFERKGSDILMVFSSGDELVLKNYLYSESYWEYKVNQIQFADGITWNQAKIREMVITNGTDGNDTITGLAGGVNQLFGKLGNDVLTGAEGADVLNGGEGADVISGGAGADILIGGAGNDTLDGGGGDDTFVFARGFGHDAIAQNDGLQARTDVVKFSDLASTDLLASERVGADVVLSFHSGDRLNLKNFLYSESYWEYKINQIQFADGVVWDQAQIKAKGSITNGTGGNDTLTAVAAISNQMFGFAGDDVLNGADNTDLLDGGAGADTIKGNGGNDTLTGGTGNDSLDGGSGNDTFLFARGFGNDTVIQNDGVQARTDVVKFTDLASTDVLVCERVGTDVVLTFSGGDVLTLKNYLYSDSYWEYKINQIQFADGVSWDQAQIKVQASAINGTDGDDTLTGLAGLANRMNGKLGNDVLTGAEQGDILDGGAGNDTLTGNAGNDTLTGGIGNDILNGGAGSDTFLFASGFGSDILNQNDGVQARVDVVKFTDLNSTDLVSCERIGANVLLTFNTGDKLTLANFLYSDSYWEYKINQIQFADGVTWDQATIKANGSTTNGTDSNDTLTGVAGAANRIFGKAGDDVLNGADLGDTLDGGAGNDTLTGNAGNDILTGGAGDDKLDGGAGSDTFQFARGFGSDVISQNDGGQTRTDLVKFTDLNSTDLVSCERIGAHVLLTFNSGDKLTLNNFLYSDSYWEYKINQIQFADGVSWDQATIKANGATTNGTDANDTLTGVPGALNRIYGKAGDDTLNGADLGDTLEGGIGNDSLVGNAGNDTLTGGAGNDTLNGGAGSDTFLFASGFGSDTIVQNDGVLARVDMVKFADLKSTDLVSCERIGANVLLTFNSGDKLTLSNFLYSESYWEYKINQIQFADNVTWDQATIKAQGSTTNGTDGNDTLTGVAAAANRIYGKLGDDVLNGADLGDTLDGGAGNDSLVGNAGNDTLIGGAGNDTLNGGAGSDTFLFASGFGSDTIVQNDGVQARVDMVKFTDLKSTDLVSCERIGANVLLTFNSGDKLTLSNFLYSDSYWEYKINQIQFADNVTWDQATIKAQGSTTNGTDANDTLTGVGAAANRIYGKLGDDVLNGAELGDTLDGGAGNDSLVGNAGNDTLIGGAGNDTLNGGAGSDTFVFARGFGNDTISQNDGVLTRVDLVHFTDLKSTDLLAFERAGANVVLTFNSGDRLVLSNFLYSESYWEYKINEILFSDGVRWNQAQIKEKSVINGTDGDDTLTGTASIANTIYGKLGNDVLNGAEAADVLDGGAGADKLNGNGGNDVLTGGLGNDVLNGGSGNDTFVFGQGFGLDTIVQNDGTAVRNDLVKFTTLSSTDLLSAGRVGADVVLSFNSGDKLTLANFLYSDSYWEYKVNQIQFADGVSWDQATIKAQASAAPVASLSPPIVADGGVGLVGVDANGGFTGM